MSIQEFKKGPKLAPPKPAEPAPLSKKNGPKLAPPKILATLPADERHSATAICNGREDTVCQLICGVEVQDLSALPCTASTAGTIRSIVLERYPGFRQAVRAGGLGAHHDITIHTDTQVVRAELKVTKKNASTADVLKWTPWIDTVQFLQGQLTSQIGKRFLCECGEPMIQAWFQEVVLPFSSKIGEAAGMTAAGYQKAMSTINMVGKQEEAAVAFINALRAQKTLQKELQALWLDFEVRWLSTHSLDDAGLEGVIREIIESKDAWICIAKNQVQWVDGLRVIRLESFGVAPKRKGGMLFRYQLTLQSGSETKTVPIECKFHWKNGGQAVQNINFLLL